MAKENNEVQLIKKDAPASVPETKPEVESIPTTARQTEHAINQRFNIANDKRHQLVNYYRNEAKIPVTISPFYAAYLGKVVRQSVNGITVFVPADGATYKINTTHAGELIAKIRKIDAMISRQKAQSDVRNNHEQTPGALTL